MIAAYPLQWPTGWPRTCTRDHKHGKFGTRSKHPGNSWYSTSEITVADAINRVLDELQRMGIDRQDIVISTNIRTRLDGLPRSGEKEPDDSGAVVYWESAAGARRVMAIDQYVKVADNIAAIAATLDAMRAIERHGGAQILDRAFTGFVALPGAAGKRYWREVMGFSALEIINADVIRARYRKLASDRHPDKGGSHDAMVELNRALAEAEQEIARVA